MVTQAFEDGGITAGSPMVVPPEGTGGVGIRSDDCNLGKLFDIKRQQVVILEQYQGAAGGFIGIVGMLLAIQALQPKRVIFGLLVK